MQQVRAIWTSNYSQKKSHATPFLSRKFKLFITDWWKKKSSRIALSVDLACGLFLVCGIVSFSTAQIKQKPGYSVKESLMYSSLVKQSKPNFIPSHFHFSAISSNSFLLLMLRRLFWDFELWSRTRCSWTSNNIWSWTINKYGPGSLITHGPGPLITYGPGPLITHGPGPLITYGSGPYGLRSLITHGPGPLITQGLGPLINMVLDH